jgi:hypothetical protein
MLNTSARKESNLHHLPNETDDGITFTSTEARGVIAGIVRVAVADYRKGVEPHASEAAAWLDLAVGNPRWRDVAASLG